MPIVHQRAHTLYYTDTHPKSSEPPIVFLHSLGASGPVWAPQIGAIIDRRVITIDAQGHGRSTMEGPPTLRGWVEDLEVILQYARVARLDIVGCSLGAVQALSFAAQHQDRVRSMCLASAFDSMDESLRSQRLDWMRTIIDDRGMRAYAAEYARSVLGRDRHDTASERLVDSIAQMGREAYLSSAQACFEVTLTADELAQLRTPILLVYGELDERTPPSIGRRLQTVLPNAALTVIPGAGHLPFVDAWKPATAALLEFLKNSVQ